MTFTAGVVIFSVMKTLIENFPLNARRAGKNADALASRLAAEKLGIPPEAVLGVEILNRSIDSRRREPTLVYRLLLEVEDRFSGGLPPADEEYLKQLAPAELQLPESKLRSPVVVGTGPAGIFGALALAMAGAFANRLKMISS